MGTRMWALGFWLAAGVAWAQVDSVHHGEPTDDVEVFVDRSETFIRAGTLDGLRVGRALPVYLGGKAKKRLGVATVMEVWDSLARVSLDEKSRAEKGPRLVSLRERVAPAAPSAPSTAAPELGAPSSPPAPEALPHGPEVAPAPEGGFPPEVPDSYGSPPSGGGFLTGRAELGGAGPFRRVVVYNDGPRPWTRCELRLPDNRRYLMHTLRAGDRESVMLYRFNQDGVERDVGLNRLAVTCIEGSATFPM